MSFKGTDWYGVNRSSPQLSANVFIDPIPSIIPCNIEIAHHQLRDLLQPAGEKGKVLFVNRLKIDSVDFATRKVSEQHIIQLASLLTVLCLSYHSPPLVSPGKKQE